MLYVDLVMALRDVEQWNTFFKKAVKYASTFIANRITEEFLSDLSKENITDLGITIVGDILGIIRHSKYLTSSTGPTVPPSSDIPRSKPATVKQPCVTSGMTNPQFRKFRIDWDVYKKLVDIHPAQLAVHLHNCCDSTVQNSLINTTSNFFNLNETEMLLHIESIVTSQSNPSVHRMTFSAITQSERETMQDFLVRLRSTAQDCEFSCPSCHFDLQSINVKDQFTRGLYNETLQTDILAKAGHLNTLGQIVKHAEAFESALRDCCTLLRISSIQV